MAPQLRSGAEIRACSSAAVSGSRALQCPALQRTFLVSPGQAACSPRPGPARTMTAFTAASAAIVRGRRKSSRLRRRINGRSLNGTSGFTAASAFAGNCQGAHKGEMMDIQGVLRMHQRRDEVSIWRLRPLRCKMVVHDGRSPGSGGSLRRRAVNSGSGHRGGRDAMSGRQNTNAAVGHTAGPHPGTDAADLPLSPTGEPRDHPCPPQENPETSPGPPEEKPETSPMSPTGEPGDLPGSPRGEPGDLPLSPTGEPERSAQDELTCQSAEAAGSRPVCPSPKTSKCWCPGRPT